MEAVRPSDPNSPTFEHYFANPVYGKDYKIVADAWLDKRAALIPIPYGIDDERKAAFAHELEKAVVTCGQDVLSSRFHYISTALNKSSNIILWTQGATIEFQQNKVNQIKQRWEDDFGIPQDHVLELVGEAKIDLFDQAIVKAESVADRDAEGNKETLPIIIIEDKISNMMKVMKRYIELAGKNGSPLAEIPQMNEYDLDKMTEEEFQSFILKWRNVIERHKGQFQRFHFIYVPPEKELGERDIINVSPIRDARIRQWLTLSDETLRAKKAGFAVFQHSPNHFFHIDEESTKLDKIITHNAVILIDVDGPLISQTKVLASREEILRKAFMKQLEAQYHKAFMLDFGIVAYLIFGRIVDPVVVYAARKQTTDQEAIIDFATGPDSIKHDNIKTMILRTDMDQSVRLRVKQESDASLYEFNKQDYRRALDLLGFSMPFIPGVLQ